ncbi:unnamed protein product [Arctia plantaginis]|uniref:Uncharacterized protein n=1 Tax=Arctia plantaginis TaxID=874455 RepID=A0A8S1A1P3_ARCPL|nr:unnamed protein product [Arctia plantaginis]
MISLLVRLSLVLLVLNISFCPADALWGKSSKDPGKPKTFAGNTAGLPPQPATRKGLGISAWGIVSLIVTLILAGMGVYYFAICYTVCQPTKGKYDKMDMPTMA